MYDKLKPSVAELYRRQMKLMSDWVQQAKNILDNPDCTEDEEDEAYTLLAKVQLGMPKHKQLMRLMEDASIRKALDKKDLEFHSDNNRGLPMRWPCGNTPSRAMSARRRGKPLLRKTAH